MTISMKRGFGGWVLAGGLGLVSMGAIAQSATNGLPDAQVEANVLRALASAPDLSTQNIQSATVYGTVTLTGNVHDEAMRTKAENLVARAAGVKKVVDQMSLGDTPPPAQEAATEPDPSQGNVAQGNVPQGQVLLSDGTYGPPPADTGAPAQNAGNNAPPPHAYNPQGYQNQGPQPPSSGRQPMGNSYAYQPPAGIPGGQRAGIDVTIPAGAVLRIRINRGLDSNHIQPGAVFDGTVLTDVVAGGAVAVPRGATVSGTVVDSKKAGVFKGEGELGLQINSVTLGGNVYPVSTQVWQREGQSKAAGTVNNTAAGAVVGALFGAVIGGGKGAAIGAGVGAGAGVAGSAASPRGQVIIPPESVLTFTTAQPVAVKTVSEAEMARLSYAAGPGQAPPPAGRPMRRYYSPYYGYYWGPAY